MINTIVINNTTAKRATVIATRTQSNEMGVMWANGEVSDGKT